MSGFGRAIAIVVCFGTPALANARCPTPEGASTALAGASSQARVRYLRDVLSEQRSRAAWWNWGFPSLGYGLAAGQLVLGLSTEQNGEPGEPNQRALYLVNASRGTLGATWALLQPLQVDASALDTALTFDDELATCAWLANAEANLAKTAQNEQRHRAPIKHVVVVMLAVASGLILGFGFDEWGRGGLSAGMGLVLGESQIWLQPMGAVGALERYGQGAIASADAGPRLLGLVPWSHGAGLALGGRF